MLRVNIFYPPYIRNLHFLPTSLSFLSHMSLIKKKKQFYGQSKLSGSLTLYEINFSIKFVFFVNNYIILFDAPYRFLSKNFDVNDLLDLGRGRMSRGLSLPDRKLSVLSVYLDK